MKGQLIVMLVLGVIYSIGLFLIGLDFALLFGMLAGIVSFVPYLGLIVGLASAGIAAVIQFQDAWHPLGVLVVFSVGQIAEAVWLTPTLVGDRIGLHPVAVIFAVLAGGFLFGFFGVLLALPAAAVIMVLLRHSYRGYLGSRLYLD
jgi:predicted PurR-regulated permease PerM